MIPLTDSLTKPNISTVLVKAKRLQRQTSITTTLSYQTRPISLMRVIAPEIKWPKKLRLIFGDIWKGNLKKELLRAIIKAPRGGGKSQIIATLGFCLWYLYDRQCIDMGGSLEQAKEVYKYFISYVENEQIDIISGLPKDPTLQLTYNAHKKYFKCVTASPKQVRGPHPDVLLGDEVCETDDEIIRSALPMVSTSEHPLVVLTSTFHKIFGIFQEIWDSAPQLGYKRYSWDIFDVVRTFDPAIWNDENYKREIPDFDKLRQLSKDTQGKYRFGDPEG